MVPVGADARGATLDSATSTLYVANADSDTVSMVDTTRCDASTTAGCEACRKAWRWEQAGGVSPSVTRPVRRTSSTCSATTSRSYPRTPAMPTMHRVARPRIQSMCPRSRRGRWRGRNHVDRKRRIGRPPEGVPAPLKERVGQANSNSTCAPTGKTSPATSVADGELGARNRTRSSRPGRSRE